MGLRAFNSGPRNNLLQAVSSEIGMTESECMHAVLSAIKRGKVLDVMTYFAQAEMCDWIEEQGLLFGGDFLILINMGDKAMFCESSVDMSTEDPLISVTSVEQGKEELPPKWASGLPTWEIPFWMMEIGD
jgi:hypothetical protein